MTIRSAPQRKQTKEKKPRQTKLPTNAITVIFQMITTVVWELSARMYIFSYIKQLNLDRFDDLCIMIGSVNHALSVYQIFFKLVHRTWSFHHGPITSFNQYRWWTSVKVIYPWKTFFTDSDCFSATPWTNISLFSWNNTSNWKNKERKHHSSSWERRMKMKHSSYPYWTEVCSDRTVKVNRWPDSPLREKMAFNFLQI